MSYLEPLLAYGDGGLVIVRVVVGAIFVAHGIPKLFGSQPGVKGFTAFLQSQKIPLAGIFGVLVPALEFFGGIALILGFLTQWIALLLGIQMVVATYLKAAKWKKGFTAEGGWEYDLLLIAVAFLFLLAGGGLWSLDASLG